MDDMIVLRNLLMAYRRNFVEQLMDTFDKDVVRQLGETHAAIEAIQAVIDDDKKNQA